MDWLTQFLSGLPQGAPGSFGGPGVGNWLNPSGGPNGTATPLATGAPLPHTIGNSMPPIAPPEAALPEQGGGPPGQMLPPPGQPLDLSPPGAVAPIGQSLQPGNPQQDFSQKLLAGLRGVQAPPPRDVVKPTTPAAPRPTAQIQQGQLFNILSALSQRPQMRTPPTLGGAVGIGRY